VPDKFPFEIVDNPGDQSIVLKRVFGKEIIKATVFADFEESPEDYEDEEEEDEGNEEGEEEEEDEDEEGEGGRSSLSVVVTVEKGEGPSLEFVCNFNEEGYEINSLMIRKSSDQGVDENAYQGPEFA
jgi:complement component 1 Q subcomponent-binding protein, mitochondrial